MEILFYNSRVHDYLLTLEKATYAKVFKQIKLLETYAYTLSMPYSKPIARNLFELRIRGKQEIRILYCFYKDKIYLLNAFIKKTKTTPNREIDCGERRVKLVESWLK